jgi:hypothetical protein
MSEIDQILAQVPIDQIAAELGVAPDEAETAARTALPALLGGLQANAQDPSGAASLGAALSEHDGSLLGADLSDIDTGDGAKIVSNIFGDHTDSVIHQLGGVSGTGGSALVRKLLPILAPIVLSYLASKLASQGGLGNILGQVLGGAGGTTSGTSGGTSTGTAQEQPSGPLIPTGGQAAPAPSGQGGAASSNPMGGVLGDILGQVLGGAGGASSGSAGSVGAAGGNILGDILGGLLGGGKR